MTSPSQTSLSLLKRLKLQPADEQAWREFVARYGTQILAWCRYWGLQEADAADVTQNVLLKIAKGIQGFTKKSGGSFRAWLKTIAHHAWYDLVQSRQFKVAKGGSAIAAKLESAEAPDDLAARLESAWDQELLQLATERVQLRVHPQTWQAFELAAKDGLSGEEVAERLQLSLSTAYKAKSNVLKLLQEEARNLEASEFA